MRKTLVVLGMVVALVGFVAISAQADTISSITITDSVTFNSTSLATATSATFGSPGNVAAGASGVYAGIGPLATVSSPNNFLSWSGGAITSGNVEWTDGAYTFDVTSGSVGANGYTTGNIALFVPGQGNVTGTYSLAYTLTGATTSGGYTLSVSYDQAVPEPATLLLLGVGLLGLGLVGLKWKKKA